MATSMVPKALEAAPEAKKTYAIREQDVTRAEAFGRACGVSPVVGQVLLHRGFEDATLARRFLNPKLADLTSPAGMVDRGLAAERLAHAVRERQRIIVYGDYDVDGTTSAAILSGILVELGGDVRAMVGSRFDGGYGLSDLALDRVLRERPAVLVTCDCGSSDHARIARARSTGVDVIVVDHHLVPAEPLPAYAFLNPHRPDCGFAFKGLCSAGLALSVGAAVRAELKADIDLRTYLDLVALGTIADIAPLEGDNRALVRAGLLQLSSESVRPGVRALREVARLKPGIPLSAMDVAFRLTPRLNAPGRLGDPTLTLNLLLERDLTRARALAAQIERINAERREIERCGTEGAHAQVASLDPASPGILVASEAFHRGVVGITAARLVDRYGKPALVVALANGVGHGSGRAPDGFPLHKALSRASHLLEKFGGHDAAVGFSVLAEHIPALRSAFAEACGDLETSKRDECADIDARIDGLDYELPRVEDLLQLEPFGEGNPDPLFELHADVLRSSVVGEGHLKVSLRVGARELSGFGYAQGALRGELGDRVRIIGHLRQDSYRGGSHIEVRMVDIRPLPR